MPTAVITHALRTPIGRYGGALAGVRPDDLAAIVIRALVERSQIDPHAIEDVILGCANQAGEDNRNVARMAVLLAGLPDSVGGVTVNRLCASGLAAIIGACHAVLAGTGESARRRAARRVHGLRGLRRRPARDGDRPGPRRAQAARADATLAR